MNEKACKSVFLLHLWKFAKFILFRTACLQYCAVTVLPRKTKWLGFSLNWTLTEFDFRIRSPTQQSDNFLNLKFRISAPHRRSPNPAGTPKKKNYHNLFAQVRPYFTPPFWLNRTVDATRTCHERCVLQHPADWSNCRQRHSAVVIMLFVRWVRDLHEVECLICISNILQMVSWGARRIRRQYCIMNDGLAVHYGRTKVR